MRVCVCVCVRVCVCACVCLQGECTDEQGELTTKGRYLMTVDEMIRNNWSDDSSIQEKWNTLKSALSDAAEADLGHSKRRQPDWFQDNSSKIRSLIEKRNKMYSLWLSTGMQRDR